MEVCPDGEEGGCYENGVKGREEDGEAEGEGGRVRRLWLREMGSERS